VLPFQSLKVLNTLDSCLKLVLPLFCDWINIIVCVSIYVWDLFACFVQQWFSNTQISVPRTIFSPTYCKMVSVWSVDVTWGVLQMMGPCMIFRRKTRPVSFMISLCNTDGFCLRARCTLWRSPDNRSDVGLVSVPWCCPVCFELWASSLSLLLASDASDLFYKFFFHSTGLFPTSEAFLQTQIMIGFIRRIASLSRSSDELSWMFDIV
jgi:hypothetical protein